MMKMDGRDSAENQIWEKRDIVVIKEFEFKSHEDKIENSASSLSFNQRKKRERHFIWEMQWRHFGEDFRERENFSLEYREIRPLAGFGTKRRNVLREAGYAWTPGSGVSSNSLR